MQRRSIKESAAGFIMCAGGAAVWYWAPPDNESRLFWLGSCLFGCGYNFALLLNSFVAPE